MAQQFYYWSDKGFQLDMHGCPMLEGHALAASGMPREREFYRISHELRIIYGSPERSTGTLPREAVQGSDPRERRDASPRSSFLCTPYAYASARTQKCCTEVRIKLASNPLPLFPHAGMVFSAFTSREHRPSLSSRTLLPLAFPLHPAPRRPS